MLKKPKNVVEAVTQLIFLLAVFERCATERLKTVASLTPRQRAKALKDSTRMYDEWKRTRKDLD